MNGSGRRPLTPEQLAVALDRLPEGVAVFDADWAIGYVNPAGAALLGRSVAELLGRNIWVALPELGGSIFHGFLLHARSAGTPVTWAGYHPPVDRWLSATAVLADGLLQVSFHATDRLAERPPDLPLADPPGGDVDRERLRFLAEVSESMIATLDTGESATRLAELVVGRMCSYAVVALVGEDGGPGEEAWAHADPDRRADLETYLHGRLREPSGDTAVVGALLTGEPVQVPAFDEERIAATLLTPEVAEAWRRLGTTSCTIVPLRARGETFGALALMNAGDRPLQGEMDIAIAVEVARRGALALDNARLYGRQLKVAETLQHSLLTPPPDPDDLEIAVRYRPAASYQQVGGDWYDAFRQPDGATVLVIGDVVGHNVDAAAAMGQIRSILRGIAYDRPASPARVLGRVDAVLTGLGVGTLATCLIARIEQTDAQRAAGIRLVRWSSAGHLPPLLLHADGRVDALATLPERLLGAECTGARTDHERVLQPDDTLVLYTDGLVEGGRTSLDEGIDRLSAALGELAGMPLDAVCDRLLERLVPGRADDDIALLALRAHPEDGTAAG